jgi:hypothetical protein
MSCEQAIFVGYGEPSGSKVIDNLKTSSLGDCSQKCCDNQMCGIYSFYSDGTGRCIHYQLPDQLLYLEIPSTKNMKFSGDKFLNTGILMKRKIMTWIPWLILIVLICMGICYLKN